MEADPMDMKIDGDAGNEGLSSFTLEASPNPAPMDGADFTSAMEGYNFANDASRAVMNAAVVDTDIISHSTADAENAASAVPTNVEELNQAPLEKEDAAISLMECHDFTSAESSNELSERKIPPKETAIENEDTTEASAEVTRRQSDTKRRFREARSVVPGATASPSRHERQGNEEENEEIYSVLSEDLSSMISFVHRRESGTLPDTLSEEMEHHEFDSYRIVDDANSPPRIVTAEVVEDGMDMDQMERRRIVQETIENISNQAVTAEVLHPKNDNLAYRKYLAIIFILTCLVIVFVVVLVVVLTNRASGSSETIYNTPTPAPTVFVDDSVFYTIEELYDAVDAYLILNSNSSTQTLLQTSDVALRYGYPISSWNVSLITNFSLVFDPTRAYEYTRDPLWRFNEDLGDWDVSNAESMMGMFMNAYGFQGIGLEKWNVGKVLDFSFMFANSGFNGSVSGWDVSNAISMESMLSGIFDFNDDLSLWNVSRVRSMKSMFNGASSFEGSGLEQWNVSNVKDFSSMFMMCTSFDGAKGNISSWDTSASEQMYAMFLGASSFNGNLAQWDVSNVLSMSDMFSGASSYTGEGIDNWDVSKVTDMSSMFLDAYSFNGDVSQWDVGQVDNLSSMFFNATVFNRNLSAWDVSRVTSMSFLFQYAGRFNGDVSTWDVSNVFEFTAVFANCIEFDGNLSAWNIEGASSLNNMFVGATKFQGLGLSLWNTSSMLYADMMFQDAMSFTADISSWDVSNVISMNSMFDGAVSFNIDLSSWNVSSVVDMNYMFYRAASFNQNLCPWKDSLPSNIMLDGTFADSGCDDTSEATLNGTSFCASCIV